MGYLALLKHLHSIYFPAGEVPYLVDFCKTPLSQFAYDNEIGDARFNSKDIMPGFVNRADSLGPFNIMRSSCAKFR